MANSVRERILNGIGLTLLGLCFVMAVGRILWTDVRDRLAAGEEEPVTIRFAHWQLEGGVREAFDAIADEYMALHPRVKVLQLPVPERIYPNWLITQLVGKTAPDIIAMGIGMTDERRARFFVPSTDLIDLPNPWNAGTDLEGIPLRETFFDNMESCFNATLLEYFGLPISSYSVRVYYNLDLVREVTGAEVLPTTYEELVQLSRQVVAYAKQTGRQISPVAGSKYNAPTIMNRLFGSQTTALGRQIAYDYLGGGLNNPALAQGVAEGAWSLDDPEIRAGLTLMRDLGQYMQPGFMQLGRDDASFYFVQGRAVAITTGSWDATSISSQAEFRVGVGYIPVPALGNELAPFSEGVAADSSADAGLVMGLTRDSEHPDIALDFLYFMASKPMNQVFTQVSKWPPAVVGVIPDENAKIFQPFLDGYTQGFLLDFSGADGRRLVSTAFNRLVSPAGSVDAFLDTIRDGYLPAIEADLTRSLKVSRANAQRSDTTLAALAWRSLQDPDDARVADQIDLLSQAVGSTDFNVHRILRAREAVEEAQE